MECALLYVFLHLEWLLGSCMICSILYLVCDVVWFFLLLWYVVSCMICRFCI